MPWERDRVRTWLRWLLVLPAAWGAWAVAVAVGFALHNLAESLCPPAHVVSGMCVAPWFRYADTAIFCAGAGLAAALILLSCTLAAPAHRRTVALVTFGAGSLVAVTMAVAADGYRELATALVAGLLMTWWLRRRYASSLRRSAVRS